MTTFNGRTEAKLLSAIFRSEMLVPVNVNSGKTRHVIYGRNIRLSCPVGECLRPLPKGTKKLITIFVRAVRIFDPNIVAYNIMLIRTQMFAWCILYRPNIVSIVTVIVVMLREVTDKLPAQNNVTTTTVLRLLTTVRVTKKTPSVNGI